MRYQSPKGFLMQMSFLPTLGTIIVRSVEPAIGANDRFFVVQHTGLNIKRKSIPISILHRHLYILLRHTG